MLAMKWRCRSSSRSQWYEAYEGVTRSCSTTDFIKLQENPAGFIYGKNRDEFENKRSKTYDDMILNNQPVVTTTSTIE